MLGQNPFADLIPSQQPGVIMGPPEVKKPEIRQVGKQLGIVDPNTGGFIPTYTAPDKDDATDDPSKKALQDAISGLGLDELLTGVHRARTAVSSGWATGSWGALAELKPGGATPRDDFKGFVNQIQGGLINEKLAALKEASKTGASGMGALSEKEGERLASAVAAINDQMSPAALEESFREIERHARTLQAVRDGKDPRDAAVQKQYNIPPPLDAPINLGDGQDPDLKGKRLSAGQEKELVSILRTHGADAADAYLKQFNLSLTDKAAATKTPSNAIDYSAVDARARAAAEAEVARQNKLGLGESPVTTLVKSGATLQLSDEAAGVGKAAANILTLPFTGNFNPLGAYTVGRDAERLRIQNARDQLGYGGTALEIGGGFLSANPEAALAPILSTRQLVGQGAKAGAYGGALAGWGSGQGLEDSATKGLIGATAGAVLGGGTSALSARYAPRGLAPEVAQASQAEGVDLMRPMVDPTAISDYGALESNSYSQPIIQGAAARVRGQIEDRAEALGGSGTPLETEAAGTTIQGAARRFIQRSRGVADTLYNRAERLAGTEKIVPSHAIDQAQLELAQLRQNPETNAGEINFVEGLLNDLSTKGGKRVGDLRGLRTSIRGRVNEQGLTSTQAEARASRILDAATKDMNALPPGASTAFRRADTYYRERMVHIDDVLDRFLGGNVSRGQARLSGEQAFARLKSMTSPGGDGRRLAALMRELEPNERQDIAATIAQSLGRRSTDEPFSTALFLSQTRKLSPSARRTIFGPDGAQSIDNLRLLSRKLEEAEKDINRSRSATVLERQAWRNLARTVIATIAGIGGTAATESVKGGLAAGAVAVGAMGASAVRKILSARAMVNPRVSRWLAESADISTPTQAQQAVRKLGIIIGREPALAGELQPIHQMLTQRLGNLAPAAAEPDTKERDNE